MPEKFYAKSATAKLYRRRPYLRERLSAVSEQAAAFACAEKARFAGLFHDFGKYSQAFQDILKRKNENIDHAVCGEYCK
ncbi:MAG: hypothetical protein IJK52_07190 [Oscillospiraceae bacterium]|nr:hypothetical protein [Oscillospiraceae bacterium]